MRLRFQELIECCADLNSRDDALGDLNRAMDKIDELHREIALKLVDAQQILDVSQTRCDAPMFLNEYIFVLCAW